MPLSEKQKYEIIVRNKQSYTIKFPSAKQNQWKIDSALMKINRKTVTKWINKYNNENNVKKIQQDIGKYEFCAKAPNEFSIE